MVKKSVEGVISVIVPVYNVKLYLRKCIESIINQKYQSLEIILVDDGSTDGSEKICDEYAVKDKRIIVLHQENKGVSCARNAGLKVAQGDWIAFVDGDDWIDSGMYEEMIALAYQYEADIVLSRFKFADQVNQLEGNKCVGKFSVFYGTKLIEQYIQRNNKYTISPSVWDRLYRKELLQDILFQEGRIICEDAYFTVCTFCKCTKAVYFDYPFYNYRRNRVTSVSNLGYSLKKTQDLVELTELAEKKLQDYHYESLARELYSELWPLLSEIYFQAKDDSVKKYIERYRKKNRRKAMLACVDRNIGFQKRVWTFISVFSPGIIYFVKCIYAQLRKNT